MKIEGVSIETVDLDSMPRHSHSKDPYCYEICREALKLDNGKALALSFESKKKQKSVYGTLTAYVRYKGLPLRAKQCRDKVFLYRDESVPWLRNNKTWPPNDYDYAADDRNYDISKGN